MLQLLLDLLASRVTDAGRHWIDRELAATAPGRPLTEFLLAYATASRHVGRGALDLSAAERQALQALDADLSFVQWTTDDAARALLLLKLADAAPAQFHDAAVACYERGDVRQQQSWLRALAMLPAPDRFLPSALDAGRSSGAAIFEAIACDNPYPARYFPERNFNQLVLKALSAGLEVSRIVRISSRLNPELTRLVAEYVAQRRAGGRSVPPDICAAMETGSERV